jgi:hypothetical protein
LADTADELTHQGIQFHAVEARSSVRDRLRNEGVDARLGGINRFTTVADAVENFRPHGSERIPEDSSSHFTGRPEAKAEPKTTKH